MTPTPQSTTTSTISTPPPPRGGSNTPNEGSSVGGMESRQAKLENIVYVVVIVLLVGFATMFVAVAAIYINAFNSKQSSYEQLMIEVSQQNQKIDSFSHQLELSQVNATSTKK